jgi:prophage regulatory protein
MPQQSAVPLAILRLKQVKARTGRSRSSIYAAVKNREFPAPVNIGVRAVGWIESEIADWITARIVESRGKSK